ncbi:MAG: SRPBCC family protein [Chitinophagaceae bacterium]|nr:SRPBCC family protein [Chitinophagaceae bacterium]MCB9045493.1 SRPBCC family protein [Chitinophagales bacterium]
MKKVLRFLGILILILLVGYLILCATAPATLTIERSITINAPKDMVWNQMVNLKNYEHWSPWAEQDSTINSVYSGTDGQVGARSEWTSARSGSGNMTITSVDGYTMNFDLQFITPFKGEAKCSYKVEGEDGKVVASQTYSQETGFLMRGAATLFTGKMLGANFERGLELLKNYCESGKAEMPAPHYEITEVTFPATKFAAIRKVIPFAEMDGFFKESYGKIGAAAGDKITGHAYDITYMWDQANGQADVAAAFPVSADVKGMTMINVPESKGYKLQMVGSYSMENFMNAHSALHNYAAENGLTDPLMLEEYVAGPQEEADSNKYITNIYYLHQ